MRYIAILLIIFGATALLISCQMDTSVETAYGGRVINLPLAAQQQNGTIFGGVLFLAGVVLYGLSSSPKSPLLIDDRPDGKEGTPIAENVKSIWNDLLTLNFKNLLAIIVISLLLFVLLVVFGVPIKLALVAGIIGAYIIDRERRKRRNKTPAA